MMTRSQWLELAQLAERHCPTMRADFPSLTDDEALGVLRHLRRLDSERFAVSRPPSRTSPKVVGTALRRSMQSLVQRRAVMS